MARIVLNMPGNETDDHQPMIQKALDDVEAAGGGVVFIPDGTHMIGPSDEADGLDGRYSLKLASNVHLQLGESVTLVRRYKGGTAVGATIRNKVQVVPPPPEPPTPPPPEPPRDTNITVSGGTILTNGEDVNKGKHLGFQRADHVTVEGVRFMGIHNDWNAEFRNCTDVRVTGVVMDSGHDEGEDGLHFSGVQRVAVSECLITCGDDALAFVDNSGTSNTEDVVVSNCYLNSRYANAIKIEMEEGGSTLMRRIAISNIVGKSGSDREDPDGAGIVIVDRTGAQRISDVEIDGVWLDCQHSDFHPVEIASVKRVRLHRVVCRDPITYIVIDGSTDVELKDCVVDSRKIDPVQCLVVAGLANCSNIRIIGGAYRNAKHHGIQLGSESYSIAGFEVAHVELSNNLKSGLLVERASNGLIVGNNIHDNDEWGIQENAGSRNMIIGNHVLDNGSGPIFSSGTNPELIRNVPPPLAAIVDTGGFRQSVDGWRTDGNLTGLNNAPMDYQAAAPPFARFRAARAGSVTGLVITSSAPQTQGTLTATVFRNIGDAGSTTAGDQINLGLSAQLNATFKARHAVNQAKDLDPFDAGDELYVVLTTSSSPAWLPTSASILCAIEIET